MRDERREPRAVRPLPSATWRTAEWIVGNTLRILAVVAPLLLLLATGLAPAACTTEVSKPDDYKQKLKALQPFRVDMADADAQAATRVRRHIADRGLEKLAPGGR